MKVTTENYFEAAQALYWYCANYHSGLSCPLYSILSRKLGYTPSPSELGVSEEDTFYKALESGEILAEDMLSAIHEAMGVN